MDYLPRLALTASVALSVALATTVALTSTILAARSGEIAFENNRDGNWEIYLLDIQTGITHNLTSSQADDITPAWSPDGSQIAFVSDRDTDNHPEIYIMDANGSHVRRLRMDMSIYGDPMWTADGRSLVLNHGWQQIYLVDVYGSGEQWLGIGFAPRMSADSQRLVFYADSNNGVNSNIYILDRAANQVTALTSGQTHDWDATWSPDNQELLFVSSRDGRPGIYVMNTDGSDIRAITRDGYDLSPAWSPDGSRIIYSSGVMGEMRLFMVNADGSNARLLTNIDGDSHAPVWRPQPG